MQTGDKVKVIADVLGHGIPIGTECIVFQVLESGNILCQVIDGIRHRVLIEEEYEKL
ncbi:MAG: hypothetical protein WC979_00070 [Candidatus Pacearchaeota archaeon]|jgi:hypothetical protein|nr:hypothetical protein [Clostridia bacterium]